MSELDINHYAEKILKQTQHMQGNFNYPLPVKRLRALCNKVLDRAQEPEKLPPLTDVERSVLTAIEADFQQGKQPTVRSVAERLEYRTPSSAGVVITRLVKLGYLKRQGSKKQIVLIHRPG